MSALGGLMLTAKQEHDLCVLLTVVDMDLPRDLRELRRTLSRRRSLRRAMPPITHDRSFVVLSGGVG